MCANGTVLDVHKRNLQNARAKVREAKISRQTKKKGGNRKKCAADCAHAKRASCAAVVRKYSHVRMHVYAEQR